MSYLECGLATFMPNMASLGRAKQDTLEEEFVAAHFCCSSDRHKSQSHLSVTADFSPAGEADLLPPDASPSSSPEGASEACDDRCGKS